MLSLNEGSEESKCLRERRCHSSVLVNRSVLEEPFCTPPKYKSRVGQSRSQRATVSPSARSAIEARCFRPSPWTRCVSMQSPIALLPSPRGQAAGFAGMMQRSVGNFYREDGTANLQPHLRVQPGTPTLTLVVDTCAVSTQAPSLSSYPPVPILLVLVGEEKV